MKLMRISAAVAAGLAIFLTGAAGAADRAASVADVPRLADIFQDGMVLQREMPVPVWGWAAPMAGVEVSFAGQTVSGKANDKGYWKVELKPLKGSVTGSELVMKSGSNQITLKNVVVGEVWVGTGHSIMGCEGPDVDMGVYPRYVSPGTAGGLPEIRMREFGWGASREPMEDTPAAGRGKMKWTVMPENPPRKTMNSPEYFARVIRDELKVPVGIISVANEGTRMLTYTARETLESYPATTGSYANYYEQCVGEWEKGAAKGKNKSWAEIQAWLDKHNGADPGEALGYPTALYNSHIHPLAPFAFRGLISMQMGAGAYAGDYTKSFVEPFKQWRKLFGRDFWVIILPHARDTANYQPPLKPTVGWFYRSDMGSRQAPALFGGEGKVDFTELFDVGDFSVHFFDAMETGRRAGLAALTRVYGEQRDYTGPRVKDSRIDGGKVRIEFEHCGEGLVYQPSINGISGIYLKGADGTVRWGEVKVVDKNTIECSHPEIKKVQYVAYAYYPNPHETLFNGGLLPATPFEVNPDHKGVDWAKSNFDLVKIEKVIKDNTEKKGFLLSVPHVRREGYVFSVLGSGTVAVQVYVPDEWKGCEVESEGKTIAVETVTENGAKYVRFNVDAKMLPRFDAKPDMLQRFIVAEKGKAAEFRKINRY